MQVAHSAQVVLNGQSAWETLATSRLQWLKILPWKKASNSHLKGSGSSSHQLSASQTTCFIISYNSTPPPLPPNNPLNLFQPLSSGVYRRLFMSIYPITQQNRLKDFFFFFLKLCWLSLNPGRVSGLRCILKGKSVLSVLQHWLALNERPPH